MLSAAGLTGGVSATGKSKTLGLVPPPTGAQKIRTPLPPPPNDPAAARMTSGSHVVALKGPKENTRRSTDPFTDLSQLEVSHYYLLCTCYLTRWLVLHTLKFKFKFLKLSEPRLLVLCFYVCSV